VGIAVLSSVVLWEGSFFPLLLCLIVVKLCSGPCASAAPVGVGTVLALLVCVPSALPVALLATLGPGSGGGALRAGGSIFGGGMVALSSASRRATRGVMAALMVAVIRAGSDESATGSVGLAGGGWRVLALEVCLGSPRANSGADVAFLGRGVGEGSAWGVVAGSGAVVRPRGVAYVEGCLAAHGGFVRVGVGVEGAGVGVEPEAVRFLPVAGS
jgi:hypothetical protein